MKDKKLSKKLSKIKNKKIKNDIKTMLENQAKYLSSSPKLPENSSLSGNIFLPIARKIFPNMIRNHMFQEFNMDVLGVLPAIKKFYIIFETLIETGVKKRKLIGMCDKESQNDGEYFICRTGFRMEKISKIPRGTELFEPTIDDLLTIESIAEYKDDSTYYIKHQFKAIPAQDSIIVNLQDSIIVNLEEK